MIDRHRLAIAHGAFDVVAGAWPLLNLRSFEAVTGPKPEGWLVKTVGTLVTGIGAVLVMAGMRRRVTPEIATLAVATSVELSVIDLVYAGVRRRISPVYLLDAVVELGLIAAWWRATRQRAVS